MSLRNLDLNLLRVLDEVLSERNITRAARNLAMTQPAVSNAIRRLRDALGDELVVRSGQGVEPTPAALALWPAVRSALATLRDAIEPGRFDPASDRRSFVIAMADATAALLVPPLVQIIETRAPAVSLRVLPLTTRDPRPQLESGALDAAIGYFPAATAAITLAAMQQDGGERFGQQRLYESHYVCVMRAAHPLAAAPELTLDDYCAAHHLLVSFSGRPFGFVDEALAAIGRSRRIVLTVNQFFTAGQVVAHSDLLTVLPDRFIAATGIRREFAVRPLPFETPLVHVDLLWHSRRQARPEHAWLRDAFAQAAASAFDPRQIAGRRGR
ncbi:MAG TPA: LysR family transcriptional regulator [Burkholderiaceae bacterium]|nr:LysR family transcriptional regulator [Burkholderiaceae bacterium]